VSILNEKINLPSFAVAERSSSAVSLKSTGIRTV